MMAVASGTSEPTDARILDLAADHIRRHGLERTRIVSIARDAGMSHANVYRYFPSKEALIDAVTDHWLRPIESGLRDIADGPDPAQDKLDRVLGHLFRAYRDKLERDRSLFDLFAMAVIQERPIARRHHARVTSGLGRIVEAGMAEGSFKPGDQRRTLTFILDVTHRFLHPSNLMLDARVPRSQLQARFDRVARALRRALGEGIR